jgi:hypothetical protein
MKDTMSLKDEIKMVLSGWKKSEGYLRKLITPNYMKYITELRREGIDVKEKTVHGVKYFWIERKR